jgi:L-iditol 2-dehydrogenase
MESAALLEPLTVAVYSVQRCEIGMGDAVLVLGAGPVGLLSLLAAKEAGATQVAITGECCIQTHEKSNYTHRCADVNADRLQFAKKLGAHSIHLIATGKEPRQVAQEIAKSLGRRPTAALECSGAESSIQLGLHVGVHVRRRRCLAFAYKYRFDDGNMFGVRRLWNAAASWPLSAAVLTM